MARTLKAILPGPLIRASRISSGPPVTMVTNVTGGPEEMRDARISGPGKIAFNVRAMGDGRIFLVLLLRDGRLSTYESITSSGHVLVKDGNTDDGREYRRQ